MLFLSHPGGQHGDMVQAADWNHEGMYVLICPTHPYLTHSDLLSFQLTPPSFDETNYLILYLYANTS